MEILTLYAITYEQIKIQKCLVPPNDLLNFSFVKDKYSNAEKMARKGGKMMIYESQILGLTLYNLPITYLYLFTVWALQKKYYSRVYFSVVILWFGGFLHFVLFQVQ